MERIKTWRVALVTSIALVVFALAPTVSGQSSTPVAHEAHHASTAHSGSACLGMTTPSANGAMGMGTPGMGRMGTPGMGDMGMMMDPEQFDLIFIDLMIAHHESTVAVAHIAVERGERPEVLQLAEDIISTQEREISQLATWRDAWYPDAPTLTMDQMRGGLTMMEGMSDTNMMDGMDLMTMMDPEADAARMCTALGPFDLAFIDAMIPQHQSAIMMAEAAAQHAAHPEIQELSQTMMDSWTRELAHMECWRDGWSGEATPSRR